MKILLGIPGAVTLAFFSLVARADEVHILNADEIRLNNGDVLKGTIVERNAARIVLQHDQLGRLVISRADIASPPPELVKVWKTSVDVAANGASGNTDNQSFRFALGAVREAENKRLALDTSYTLGYTDGKQDQNKFTAGALQYWFSMNTPWLVFADARYDSDDFQTWRHRLAAHSGPGYRFIATETFTFIGRAGLGVAKEWGSLEEESRPEGLVGVQALWKVSDRQSLAAEKTAYPSLKDGSDYRIVSKLDWALRVDEAANMSLIAGLYHEYQSHADPGFRNYDLNVFAGLRFLF